MTLNVSLTPQLAEYIRRKVESGSYTSASEVVREALRLHEQRDQEYQQKLDALRADIQAGLNSGPAEVRAMDDIIAEARREHEKKK